MCIRDRDNGGQLLAQNTQIEVLYWDALTDRAGQWSLEDFLKREEVYDITVAASPVLVTTKWSNETTSSAITVTPVVGTDVKQVGRAQIKAA